MNSGTFASLLVGSLILGVVYALVALGYVVVFRASGIFNFLHPQFMLIGALLVTTLRSGSGVWTFIFAIAVSAIVVGGLGGTVYVTIVHRTNGHAHWIQMILTMGLGLAAVNIAQIIWGTNFRVIKPPFAVTTWRTHGASITSVELFVVILGVVTCVFLYWLLTVSMIGLRLRATAENSALAAYSGINLRRWFAFAWGIAAIAAVLAGVSYSLRVPLDVSLVDVGLVAFPAALIGGMDSVEGCFVGAIILALVQQFSTYWWGSAASTAVAFSLVLVVLVVRPRGLFGSETGVRV